MPPKKSRLSVSGQPARSCLKAAPAYSAGSRPGAGLLWQEEPLPPAFSARSHFASVEGVHPFEMPSQMVDVFEQRPRRQALGSGDPPGALVRITQYIALSCRFSRCGPISGHPSSSFGFQAFPPIPDSIAGRAFALPDFHARSGEALRARTLNQIGDPSNPNAARI